jgi:hypothetical protein
MSVVTFQDIVRERPGSFFTTSFYNGRAFYKGGFAYTVIDALIPTFRPPNGLKAILLVRGKRSRMRIIYYYKSGRKKWK